MATVSVAANNTRVEDSEAATGWSSIGGGAGGAAEASFAYQGTNLFNRKVTSSTGAGFYYDPVSDSGSTHDMTAAAKAHWMVKVIVSDYGGLNTTSGLRIRIGSGTSAYYVFVVSGTNSVVASYDEYPPRGGLYIVPVNPNITGYRDSTTGSPSLTAVDYFGLVAQFATSTAKNENVGLDAIDLGTGLTLTGGDGADPDGTYEDFRSADEGTTNNRWGYASSIYNGAVLLGFGTWTIGSATATVFNDTGATILWPDGLFAAGFAGVALDLQNATTDVTDGTTQTGLGDATTEDTRPDYVVTGTSGTATLSHTLKNFRNYTITSAVTVDGADIECKTLTQSTGTIQNTVIRTNEAANTATLVGPSFTDLTDSEFIQAGSGHAIEIESTGTVTLDNLTFTGYGADASSSAAIFNDSGGSVTLNITNGGNNPTVRNGTGASTTINNSVTITLTGLIANSRVYIQNTTDAVNLFNEVETTTTFSDTVNYTADKSLLIRVRNASGTSKYVPFEATGTLTSNGFTLAVNQILDE